MALWALAVLVQLGLGPEAFAGSTVLALVFALIDITLVIKSLEDSLNGFYVIIVGSSDIAVIADVHVGPELLEMFNDLVNILLGSNTLFSSLLLDLLTVLVRTGKEHHIIALHSSVTGNGIAGNCGIAVTDMRIARRIIDRGRNVVGFL